MSEIISKYRSNTPKPAPQRGETGKATRETYVLARDFVRAWMRAKDLEGVAEQLGASNTVTLQKKAAALRAKGVELPPLKHRALGGLHYDVDELNRIIEEESQS